MLKDYFGDNFKLIAAHSVFDYYLLSSHFAWYLSFLLLFLGEIPFGWQYLFETLFFLLFQKFVLVTLVRSYLPTQNLLSPLTFFFFLSLCLVNSLPVGYRKGAVCIGLKVIILDHDCTHCDFSPSYISFCRFTTLGCVFIMLIFQLIFKTRYRYSNGE